MKIPLFLSFQKKNNSLKSDLSKGWNPNEEKILTSLESLYSEMINFTRLYFDNLKYSINSVITDFENDFSFDLKYFLGKEIFPNIYKVFGQSSLNKSVVFLNNNNVVDLFSLFDYLVACGFLQAMYSNKKLMLYKYLEDEKSSNLETKMII